MISGNVPVRDHTGALHLILVSHHLGLSTLSLIQYSGDSILFLFLSHPSDSESAAYTSSHTLTHCPHPPSPPCTGSECVMPVEMRKCHNLRDRDRVWTWAGSFCALGFPRGCTGHSESSSNSHACSAPRLCTCSHLLPAVFRGGGGQLASFQRSGVSCCLILNLQIGHLKTGSNPHPPHPQVSKNPNETGTL